jgi:2-phospho-L-lactate guanylyltransferase
MASLPLWVVVPVKPFATAKGRLASILDTAERAHLARLMFEDVLAAITSGRHSPDAVMVATADEEAAALAKQHGADVLMEAGAAGLNEAITLASDAVEARGDGGMVVVPADVPHLASDVLEHVNAHMNNRPSIVLVEAPGDGGTNLLACRPARAIPPLFGPQSFWLHREAARHAGIRTTILKSPLLGLDIDRPDDLGAFLAMGTSTRTHAFLAGLDLAARAASDGQFLRRGITSRAMVSI